MRPRRRDAEDGAFAVGNAHAHGDEDGATSHEFIVADVFIHGVEDKVGDGFDGTGAPGFDLFIELFSGFADLV